MHESNVQVSVIIASLADAQRADSLDRAIASVLAQQGVHALPIVVVNGGRHDPDVLESLKRRQDIKCVHFSYGGLPEARLKGRQAVQTPFFAYLDDDDVLLPDSLELRLKPMLADHTVDIVVSNGFYARASGSIEITEPNIERFQHDPLRGLIEVNWLNESGGLFRTATIGEEFFQNLPPVVEWTYIAFQLAQCREIQFMDAQTFTKHDTPLSLSKSRQYILEEPSVLLRMVALPLPSDVRRSLERKYIGSLHNVSCWFLQRREFRSAWAYHLKSLRSPAGWRYFSYTRHIMWQQFFARRRARLNASATPG